MVEIEQRIGIHTQSLKFALVGCVGDAKVHWRCLDPWNTSCAHDSEILLLCLFPIPAPLAEISVKLKLISPQLNKILNSVYRINFTTSFSDSRKGKEWSIWELCWVGAGPGNSSVPTNFIRAILRTRANKTRRPERSRPNNQGPPNVYISSSRAVKQRGMWYLSDTHLYGHGVSATPPVKNIMLSLEHPGKLTENFHS